MLAQTFYDDDPTPEYQVIPARQRVVQLASVESVIPSTPTQCPATQPRSPGARFRRRAYDKKRKVAFDDTPAIFFFEVPDDTPMRIVAPKKKRGAQFRRGMLEKSNVRMDFENAELEFRVEGTKGRDLRMHIENAEFFASLRASPDMSLMDFPSLIEVDLPPVDPEMCRSSDYETAFFADLFHHP